MIVEHPYLILPFIIGLIFAILKIHKEQLKRHTDELHRELRYNQELSNELRRIRPRRRRKKLRSPARPPTVRKVFRVLRSDL